MSRRTIWLQSKVALLTKMTSVAVRRTLFLKLALILHIHRMAHWGRAL